MDSKQAGWHKGVNLPLASGFGWGFGLVLFCGAFLSSIYLTLRSWNQEFSQKKLGTTLSNNLHQSSYWTSVVMIWLFKFNSSEHLTCINSSHTKVPTMFDLVSLTAMTIPEQEKKNNWGSLQNHNSYSNSCWFTFDWCSDRTPCFTLD